MIFCIDTGIICSDMDSIHYTANSKLDLHHCGWDVIYTGLISLHKAVPSLVLYAQLFYMCVATAQDIWR